MSPRRSALIRRTYKVMTAIIVTALIFTKYDDLPLVLPLPRWSIEVQSARPKIHTGTTLKRRITIGEDCNDTDTKCHYFRPVEFVSNWELTHQKSSLLHRCYRNMIALYHLQCRDELIIDDRCHGFHLAPVSMATNNSSRLNLPIQFVYKKLYKTGGTSVDNALRRITYRSKSMRLKHFRPLKRSSNMTRAHELMERVAFNQSHGFDIPLIAVVRDPIPRFISAANQLVNMPGRLRKCEMPNSRGGTRQIMQCAVNALVRGHRDPHFESLVADMMCNVEGRYDAQFSLYSMTDMSELLEALGSTNSTKEINSSKEKSIILSISDMNDRMISAVCRWYAADVAMMKSLGFEVSYCK